MFDLSDVAYLSSEAGAADLARASAYTFSAGTLVADTAALRNEFGDHAAVLAQTVQLRRKAAAKLGRVDHWLFTDDALQQATPAAVARHRAARLAGLVVHDVTCSVGAELAALDGVAAAVIGSDIDPVRTAMARNNIGEQVLVCRADALTPTSRAQVAVADPGRRAGGRRRFDPSAYSPPLDAVLRSYADRDLVVKCAPGLDFADLREQTGFDGEIEVVSLDGGVREACLWSAGLAGARRRATVLATTGPGYQLTDADPDDCAVAGRGTGSSIRTARWCARAWCVSTPRDTVCGSWTPALPIYPGIVCRPVYRATGCLTRCPTVRSGCVRPWPPVIAGPSRSPSVALIWTPRCYAPG